MALPAFETYLDISSGQAVDLPPDLVAAYGQFTLAEDVTYANFVASADGVVAVPEVPRSSSLISGGDEGDRFQMALLRAAADVVVIGAGTFRAHRGPWTPGNADPAAAEDFAAVRRTLGLPPEPALVVVTGSGRLGGPPAKLRGGTVVTTGVAADEVKREIGDNAEIVVAADAPPLNAAGVISALAARGHRRILTEGGPALAGQLLEANAVDELFLTVSPVLVGGGTTQPRPTLAAGADLVPRGLGRAELLAARRRGSYVYLRYRLR